MAIVTFRYQPANGDAALASRVTHDLVGRLLDDGFAFASGTQLRGEPVMRMCCNNPRTTPEDLRAHDSAHDAAGGATGSGTSES